MLPKATLRVGDGNHRKENFHYRNKGVRKFDNTCRSRIVGKDRQKLKQSVLL